MPKDEFDHRDPLEIIGVELPADEDTFVEMARCFVEEFVRMGYPDSLILNMFKSPFHVATHGVYRAKGEAFVRQLVAQARMQWGSRIYMPAPQEASHAQGS